MTAADLGAMAARYAPGILSHVLGSTLFLGLVLIVLAMHRRLTAQARFSLALIGIAKFALPSAALLGALRSVTGWLFMERSPLPLRMPQALGGVLRFTPAPVTAAGTALVIVTLWLVIALALMIRFTLTRHRLVEMSVKTALPPQPREVEALARARRRAGVRRSIDLARSPLPESPAVLRVVRPLIVLPVGGCDELSDEELESLLCHECAHVARHDNLISRIESFICALFWFHPLIWIAQRVTVIERERACDEVVAGSADERETYLTALTKFCHAAIAPRLPGVSCMATAKLKQRMDHVMNLETLKRRAPAAGRVMLFGIIALILFTLGSGFVGGNSAFAVTEPGTGAYSIKVAASRAGDEITVQGIVSDNGTHKVVAAPRIVVAAGHSASTTSTGAGPEVSIAVRPEDDNRLIVDVVIHRDGGVAQKDHFIVTPDEATAGDSPTQETFSGEPINLALNDADIRDVIRVFGQLTGLEMKVDPSVAGEVSVNWRNVPWDEAFDGMMKDNGLKYRLEGKTMYVSKK